MRTDTSRIHLAGEVDAATVPSFRRLIHAAIEAHPATAITVDLSELEFIDSSGLGLLIGALKKAQLSGGEVRLTMPPRKLWRVFTVTGLSEVFTFEENDDAETEAEAVEPVAVEPVTLAP